MGRSKRFVKKNSHRKGAFLSMEEILDCESLRETVGTALYDRVMQWNDSGATEALQAAQQRQKARERRKPCWVPKLKNDLYIGTVDWDKEESEEACNMPMSAVALAMELCGEEPCERNGFPPLEDSEQGVEKLAFAGSVNAREGVIPNALDNRAVLLTSIDVPFMVDAVLENCVDGQRLLVGGWPVEPSGWDDSDAELPAGVDAPWLVEAVLEEFEDGQRLLVGGWPVQPSWDQLDTNWSQLGWEAYKPKHDEQYHLNSFWGTGGQSGWQDSSWYPGKLSSSFHQEYYMTAC